MSPSRAPTRKLDFHIVLKRATWTELRLSLEDAGNFMLPVRKKREPLVEVKVSWAGPPRREPLSSLVSLTALIIAGLLLQPILRIMSVKDFICPAYTANSCRESYLRWQALGVVELDHLP